MRANPFEWNSIPKLIRKKSHPEGVNSFFLPDKENRINLEKAGMKIVINRIEKEIQKLKGSSLTIMDMTVDKQKTNNKHPQSVM